MTLIMVHGPLEMAAESPMANSGLYQLVFRLEHERVIAVGRHGRFRFPTGFYVYTGSAKRGLESRIARHLRTRKRMRWHIDYLLRYGRIVDVGRYALGDESECELSRKVQNAKGSMMVVPGFGSSDCRCPAHLFYFQRNPAIRLGSPGRLQRSHLMHACPPRQASS